MTKRLNDHDIRRMLVLIRHGASLRAAATRFGVSARTMQRRAQVDKQIRAELDRAIRLRDVAQASQRKTALIHGTPQMYRHGCHCADCRRANTARCLAYKRRRRKAGLTGDTPHGTVSGYAYWGCNCPRCREANRQQSLERRYHERNRNGG